MARASQAPARSLELAGNWVDDENFGLLTSRDNAYDGVEARRQRSIVDGKHVGGEFADYGNLVQPLSSFLRQLT